MRDPYDGKPFYCLECDAHVGLCNCTAPRLESTATAVRRQQRRRHVGSDYQAAMAKAKETA